MKCPITGKKDCLGTLDIRKLVQLSVGLPQPEKHGALWFVLFETNIYIYTRSFICNIFLCDEFFQVRFEKNLFVFEKSVRLILMVFFRLVNSSGLTL